MVFLPIEVAAVVLAVAVIILMVGFWKRSGILCLIGGIMVMGLAVFIDGIGATEFPPIIRVMVGMGGVSLLAVGVGRYGISL